MNNPLIDFLRSPDKLRRTLQRIQQLEKLEVIVGQQRGAIRFSRGNAVVSLNSGGIATTPAPTPSGPTLHPETIIWRDRAIDAGGTFNEDSIALADALIRAINAAGFNDKIIYLLPLLGGNLATARVPLRDRLNVGISDNYNFVDADFDEATGLQGNGTNKALDIKFAPDDVEAFTGSRSIGFGWWETNVVPTLASNAYIMGSFDAANQTIFRALNTQVLDFQSGDYLGLFVEYFPRGRAHYYGQRAAATDRKLYYAAVEVDTDSTSDGTALGAMHIAAFAFRDTPANGGIREHYAGRAGVIYVTNGLMTADEVAAFDALLRTFLLDPTGRLLDPTVTLDGGDASSAFPDSVDGGDAGDNFPTTFDGNPLP